MKSFWRWMTTPDPQPGITLRKLGKLIFKATLFGITAVLVQVLLGALGLTFVYSTWGMLLVVILVYIPFARILSVDFMTPPRPPASPAAQRRKERQKRKKYAGVKKGGPKF